MRGLDAGSDSLQVRSVRLRGAADGLRARQRFEAALSDIYPEALGLPPQALLIVRRIAPSVRLRLDPLGRADGFGREVHAELVRSAQRARRPWLHPDTAGAKAVLFADESELVACLARDWLRGVLAERWWWRALLRHADVSRMVPEYWLSTPEYVPAAIELLDRSGDAARFLSVITTADVLSLLDRVAQTHGLVALMPVLQRMYSKRPLGDGENGRAAVAQRDYEALKDPAGVVLDPTALTFLPKVVARQLAAPQCVLLDVCLGLRRAPGVVRSDAYAVAIATVFKVSDDATATDALMEPKSDLTASLELEDDGVAGGITSNTIVDDFVPLTATLPKNRHPSEGWGPVRHRKTAMDSSFRWNDVVGTSPGRYESCAQFAATTRPGDLSRREREKKAVPVPEGQGPSPALTPGPSRRERALKRDITFGRVDHGPTEDDDHTPDHTPTKHVEDVKPTTLPLMSPRSAENKPLSRPVDTRVVQTRLGGAFYLINVALFLELYGDFTSPLRPGIALSVWDFIALITAQLLGRGFRRDALWPLLAELAARPVQQAPGRGFEPPEAWRMPDSWLAPFRTEGLWQATSDGGRLRVFNPAGFMVLDVPVDVGDPRAQLAHELSPYVATRRTSAVPELESPAKTYRVDEGPPLRRWLGWLMPYIRARLALALGVAANKKLGSLVCHHEARVGLTPTHLDISFALAELPIEIRLSGLDRDPGWVPAAGRVIRFHYE